MLPSTPGRRLPTSERVAGLLIVIVAAGLRFASLSAGVPSTLASDEPFVMERAFGMLATGDFHPHVFDYPTLYMYMQTALAAVRFLAGTLRGEWFQLDQVTASDFYVWGRALTATLGTLTVILTWRIGRRIHPTAGLLAAAFLAIQPQHVRESHFVLTDVPMTFFVTLTLLAAVRAHEAATTRAFLLAGMAAGLAAATKYTGGLSLVMPLVVAVMTPRARRLPAAGVAVAGAAGAFLVCAPYTVLDLPGFLNGFGTLARVHAAGLTPGTPPWWTYLLHLNINLGIVLVGVAVAGLVVAAVQAVRGTGPARVVWVAASVFSLLYYVEISGQTLVWGRYLMPMLPALLVLVGGTIALVLTNWQLRISEAGWRGQAAALIAAALLLGPASARTIDILTAFSKTTSNQLAYGWILRHAAPGAVIVVEAEGMKLPPRYRARNVRALIDHRYEDYVAEGVAFLVASSQASRGAMFGGPTGDGTAYRHLFRQMELVYDVVPSRDHPGSTIHVYRVVRPRP